jgi:hypothetical protein
MRGTIAAMRRASAPADQEADRLGRARGEHHRSGGRMPPITSTLPANADDRRADRPPSTAPSGNPQNISVMSVARFRWRYSGERDDVRHRAAEADTGEQSIHRELGHRFRLDRGEREHAEPDGGGDDHAPAADHVGDRSEHQRAEREPEQPGAERRSERRWTELPLRRDDRRDECDRLGVEAVEDCDQGAEHDGALLQATQPDAIDDLGYVMRNTGHVQFLLVVLAVVVEGRPGCPRAAMRGHESRD